MLSYESLDRDILIRGRNEDKTRYEKTVTYKPYFYIDSPDGNYTSLFGDTLDKIECENQYTLFTEKKKYKKTYESDVLHANRYLIDTYDTIEKEPIRICYLDIETEDRDGFPDISKADKPILSIAFYDNFTDNYTILVTSPTSTERIEKRIFDLDEDEINVNYIECEKEQQMLRTFVDLVIKLDFDIFYAWNGGTQNWKKEGGFDYHYIFNRMKRLKLKTSKLSPIEKTDRRSGFPLGRAWLDLMKAHRKLSTQELESYALNAVGEAELGIGKMYHEEKIGDMWENNLDKFSKYNLKDVYIMVGIDNKKGVTDYLDTIRRTTFCNWNDLLWNSKVLDFYALKYAKKLNIVLPNKNKGNEDEASIEGARVLIPIIGIHKGIAALDVMSLYPTAIVTCNMSPETLINEQYANENNIPICKVDDICFRVDKRGFVPLIVEDLWKLRTVYKKERNKYSVHSNEYAKYDTLQTVCKFLINSIYGVLLLKVFRLYNRNVGKSVTYFGRKYNEYMESFVLNLNYKPILGDTDSIYVKLKTSTYSDRVKEAKLLAQKINDTNSNWCDKMWGNSKFNQLELEFEELYQTLVTLPARDGSAAKKRYFGIAYYKDGIDLRLEPELCFKGINAKRSDTPNILRNFQKDIFKMILLGKYDGAKEQVKMMYYDITHGKYTPEEIAIPKGMSKNISEYIDTIPIHVRGAIYANAFCGENIKRDKIKYIYVNERIRPKGNPPTNVVSFAEKFPEGYKPDIITMADKLLIYQYDTLFKVMKWDINELKGQCSLLAYM